MLGHQGNQRLLLAVGHQREEGFIAITSAWFATSCSKDARLQSCPVGLWGLQIQATGACKGGCAVGPAWLQFESKGVSIQEAPQHCKARR